MWDYLLPHFLSQNHEVMAVDIIPEKVEKIIKDQSNSG